jgi:hypothetical protein
MSGRICLILVAFSVLSVLLASEAMSQTCTENAYGQRVCTGGGGIAYHYNAAERAFYPVPARTTGTRSAEDDGPSWEVLYVTWACGFNQPENPGDVLCNDSYCTTATGERGVWRVVYRRLEGSGDPWTPWPGSNGMTHLRECLASTDPITLDQVRDELLAIVEDRYRQISAPEIRIDPSGSAIVNLPVLASTDDPGTQGFSIVNPLPGAVEAAPTYAWTWSNGDTSSGPGRPYDGTSPTGNPDYYGVLSTYSRSGGGSVALEVTWDVVLTVPGNPPVTDIAPLVYTADADFTVRSAGTVLVD